MRMFQLHRDLDISGVSGTGIVAEGVEFSDHTVVLVWLSGQHASTVFWPDGIESVEAIHGHGGSTRVVWLDGAPK